MNHRAPPGQGASSPKASRIATRAAGGRGGATAACSATANNPSYGSKADVTLASTARCRTGSCADLDPSSRVHLVDRCSMVDAAKHMGKFGTQMTSRQVLIAATLSDESTHLTSSDTSIFCDIVTTLLQTNKSEAGSAAFPARPGGLCTRTTKQHINAARTG